MSIRRTKESGSGGGGGGRLTAAMAPKSSRTLPPVTEKFSTGETHMKLAGKENPRPTSRGRASVAAMSQKPAIRPMPRMDKSSVCLGDGGNLGVRRSALSVPRGRSSSPCEFNRVFLDLHKGRASRVSVSGAGTDRSASGGGKSVSVVRVSERIQQKKSTLKDLNAKSSEERDNGSRVLKGRKISVNTEVGIEKSSEISKQRESISRASEDARVRALDEFMGDGRNSKANKDSNLKALNDSRVNEESKGTGELKSIVVEKSVNGVEFCVRELSRKTLNSSRGSGIVKQKNIIEEGMGSVSINKYPSRLHEKLAFLEGKVKRIASDIKRTKEMLDMNNPDASKVILSDIQEKISGIEKAMEHVNGANSKIGASKATEIGNIESRSLDKSQSKEVDQAKSSVKGLNSEELEARLFPHHKLIRDRTMSSGISQNHQAHLAESNSILKPEEKLLDPTDEDSVASEFLASLNKEQSKVAMRGENGGLEFYEVQETEGAAPTEAQDCSNMFIGEGDAELNLTANETLDEFDDQENRQAMIIEEVIEDSVTDQLTEIGCKISTAGWFVSEGEAVLLAHGDGSCTFYDIVNCEEKAGYKPPVEISPNIWRDCWIIRAPGADGCSGRYVVAASAGNTLDSGFCSWDFYSKDVQAFHIEDGLTTSRRALAPIPNNTIYRRNPISSIIAPENQQWWYKPCGSLMISTASCQRSLRIYDIRDGEPIMNWEVQKPVLAMQYSSPLQWRNRGKVVVAEAETISLWDVDSLNPQALLSVSSSDQKVCALHVNNTDAELGGGVRQRVSSSEAEGNDGVFCTQDSINILDFRHPSGVGLKISKLAVNVHSVFSRGDSIFLGCTNARSAGRKQPCSQVQQLSVRKQSLFSTYSLPESNAHAHHTSLTQVWGNSNFVMGVCGLGLFVFDALKDDGLPFSSNDCSNTQKVKEIIGQDDLYSPSFDYLASRVLLISRDRPALWRYLL